MSRSIKSEIATVALVVADLDRATQFYCEGLGFVETRTLLIGPELAALANVAGEFRLIERFIKAGETVVNLLYTETPRLPVDRAEWLGHRPGYSHIVVRVDDFENALERIAEYGGTVHHETRADFDNPDPKVGRTQVVNCSDPEGNRVEVICCPDTVRSWMRTPKGQF